MIQNYRQKNKINNRFIYRFIIKNTFESTVVTEALAEQLDADFHRTPKILKYCLESEINFPVWLRKRLISAGLELA